jgi:hypothetical protein
VALDHNPNRTAQTKAVRCRVGDIVAIPISRSYFAFGRVLHKHCLMIYRFVATTSIPDVAWCGLPTAFCTAFHDTAIKCGDWPVIAHVKSVSPEYDWAPPFVVRELSPLRRARYIIDRGVFRDAREEDADGAGLEEFCMRHPAGVVLDIEQRLLGHHTIRWPEPSSRWTQPLGSPLDILKDAACPVRVGHAGWLVPMRGSGPGGAVGTKHSQVRCRAGDVVAIPVDERLFAFGRLLNDDCLAVYERLFPTTAPDVVWQAERAAFNTGFLDVAVRRGEWPIVEHIDCDDPEFHWPPPLCVRAALPPHPVIGIRHHGEMRRATDEETVGMDEYYLRTPLGVVIAIEERLLKRESQAVARLREAQRQGKQTATPDWDSFSNDDAFEVQSALERARGWSTVRKGLSKAVKARGYLEAPPAKFAVAAAEVVAAGCGHAADQLPEVVPEFLARVGPPDAELLELARAAVARIAKDSELRDLWEESKHFADWQAVMNGLSKRLSRGRV